MEKLTKQQINSILDYLIYNEKPASVQINYSGSGEMFTACFIKLPIDRLEIKQFETINIENS